MKRYLYMYFAVCTAFTACQQRIPANQIINQKASLTKSIGLYKMKVITSSIDKEAHTMATLYGNDAAVTRARSAGIIGPNEQLVLVTWDQKADENWFGANIPAQVKRVEKIETRNVGIDVKYHRYDGPSLAYSSDTTGESRRINAIFGMKASIMP
jgi:hypothetical protein